jgi:hypothetical protein
MLTPTKRKILTFNHPFCLREYCQPATSARDGRRTDQATVLSALPACFDQDLPHRASELRCQVEMATVDGSDLAATQYREAATSHTAIMLRYSQTRAVTARTAFENGNAFRQFATMLR